MTKPEAREVCLKICKFAPDLMEKYDRRAVNEMLTAAVVVVPMQAFDDDEDVNTEMRALGFLLKGDEGHAEVTP